MSLTTRKILPAAKRQHTVDLHYRVLPKAPTTSRPPPTKDLHELKRTDGTQVGPTALLVQSPAVFFVGWEHSTPPHLQDRVAGMRSPHRQRVRPPRCMAHPPPAPPMSGRPHGAVKPHPGRGIPLTDHRQWPSSGQALTPEQTLSLADWINRNLFSRFWLNLITKFLFSGARS